MAQLKVKDGKKEKKTKQKKNQNFSTQCLGNACRFVQFLTYKAKLVGKNVIRTEEKHTTKKCCYCGKIHDMPSWKRVMICDCGSNILVGTEIVLLILCYVSYDKMPCGRAINKLLISSTIQNSRWISNLRTHEGITRRKPLHRRI
jgi:hypothetical protein